MLPTGTLDAMSSARRLVVSPHAGRRLEVARDWLAARPAAEELWVVGASAEAASELVRDVAERRGGAFGWHRTTPARLAAELAASRLAERGWVPVGRLAVEAVVARVLFELESLGELGRFASAHRGPGLARALADVIGELRGARLAPDALETHAPELARVMRAYADALESAGLADRPGVEALAAGAVRDGQAPGLRPLLLVDVPAPSATQEALLGALLEAGAPACCVLPAGDPRAEQRFAALLGVGSETLPAPESTSPLHAVQGHLFQGSAPEGGPGDESVELLSAPGESRECVEIARRIQRAAGEGVRFDRMAVLVRTPEIYGPFLAEALRRAGVPAHFARGTRRPDPAGRALAALLACAAEGLSARRFAEYLSLGELPEPAADGAPPLAAAPGDRWVPPDEELVAARTGEAPGAEPEEEDAAAGADLPAPRRWERLLVDAAVIGGRERWRRRLEGLAHELELRAAGLDDAQGPAALRLRRDRQDLTALCAFALPLVDALAELPARARWGEWIDALASLASRALRDPARVHSVLAELAPMADVGPASLREVQLVLAPRLQSAAPPPPGARYGKVFVAPTDGARGLEFDLVFVPGLAEKLFPRKIGEEPILLDRFREALDAQLVTRPERLEQERLALRLCAGAARERLVASYPRLDSDGARPRVPSFYALELLRAAEGRLPGFDELARRAEQVGDARLGWPAPERAEQAIDAAEYDLARLRDLESFDEAAATGAARYLLDANAHLARALRFRARRWLEGWTAADGFVKPGEPGRRALAAHALSARSFSPTALQHYAGCPYRFYLYAVWKLAPREEPEAIEELDPLQRGSLVHDVQFELLGALRDAGLLPLTPERLEDAWDHLDAVLAKVAAHYEEELAPAIERVWRDGVESVRADLREWLRLASVDASGFVPWRFELAFGLPGREAADPASRDEPVALEAGLALRGSIDLVERHPDGRLRVTDHKTGKDRFPADGVIRGGRVLQPVFYALAAEQLFPDEAVESGRLYYCTSTGGFAEREVPLDEVAREGARAVAESVGQALSEPFLPAAPDTGECRYCDYRPVCGPYEELRSARKWRPPLEPLSALRART